MKTAQELEKQNTDLLRQRDDAIASLKFVVAALTQPVQFTANIGKPDCNRCELLRSDAAAVVKHARAALASMESGVGK